MARNGQTFLANDVQNEPLYIPSELPPHDTRSELTVPLMVGDEVLGILDIQSKNPNKFDENDRSLFEALAVSIATAMRNANLYRSEQWRRQVAESFRDVAYLITTNKPINQLLDTVLERLEANLPCDATAIWLLEEDTQPGQEDTSRLRLAATRKIDPEKIVEVVKNNPETQEMLQMALMAEQPVIRKAGEAMGPLGKAMGFNKDYSSIAAPLRTGRRPLGVLVLAQHLDGRYGSEAQAITATFANYSAVAIQNARLYREAQEQAMISTMLLQVAEASQSIMTVDDLLATMVRLTRLLVGVRKCAFLLWEDSLQSYELKAWYGFGSENTSSGSESPQLLSANLPALIRLRKEMSVIRLENLEDEINLPDMSMDAENGTVLMLPLLVRGDVVGAFLVSLQMAVLPGSDQGFDPKAVAILQGIAHQTAMTLDNLQLLEARQEEAYVTAALLQVAQAVVTSIDLHDTLDTIVHLLPILVGIDGSIIYLWDPAKHLFRPVQAQAGSPREEEAVLSRIYAPGEHGLLDAILNEGKGYLCKLEDSHLPFGEWGQLACMPYEELDIQSNPPVGDWVLAYPLSMPGMVMGAMLVRENSTSPSFWERRLEIINGIAQQVSLAIQNDIFKQEMVENERIEREVQLARQIQETFLPESLPPLEGWELDTRWETAREVGGDFYDIFKLEGNQLGLVIADVSDKGLPAALYMTVTRTLIRAYAADAHSPASVLQEVNELLVNDSPDSMFITAIYAILSLDTGELVYTNAGHNRPLLFRQESQEIEELQKGGMALGILENLTLKDHRLNLQMGDKLVLFTDGVTDLMSPNESFFGNERLQNLVALYGEEDIEDLLENLDDALADFRQGTPPMDDITLVGIGRLIEPN